MVFGGASASPSRCRVLPNPIAAQAAAAVGRAYDLDELDEEWGPLLQQLDDLLMQARRPALDAAERAVAIRSLLVSTARESAHAALAKALGDIERFRRAVGAAA